jgi:BirA family biotin operon repressor/biotin-[acetyl-CoA-carboxylase] ligase
MEGASISREVLSAALLRALDAEIQVLTQAESRASLLERFTAASTWVRGKHVNVEEGGGYTGVTDGLDPQGFLRVSGDDGRQRIVVSGGVREI